MVYNLDLLGDRFIDDDGFFVVDILAVVMNGNGRLSCGTKRRAQGGCKSTMGRVVFYRIQRVAVFVGNYEKILACIIDGI